MVDARHIDLTESEDDPRARLSEGGYIFTTASDRKHEHSGRNRILIDDRVKLREKWEEKGGIFVRHTSTKETIRRLQELGIGEAPEGTGETTMSTMTTMATNASASATNSTVAIMSSSSSSSASSNPQGNKPLKYNLRKEVSVERGAKRRQNIAPPGLYS